MASNSIRSARRFNPITGEEVVISARPPSRPNSRPDCVPPLPLARTYPKEENRYRPRSQRDGSPDGGASTISWGSETGRSDVSVMQINSMRSETVRPQGVPPLKVENHLSPREEAPLDSGRSSRKQWSEVRTGLGTNRTCSSNEDDRNSMRSPSEYAMSLESDDLLPEPKRDDDIHASSRRYLDRNDDVSSCLSYRSTRSDASSVRSARRQAMDERTQQLLHLWDVRTGERSRRCFQRGFEKDEKEEAKRINHTMETVMIDQLSRIPLCEPDQAVDRHMMESALRHTPGMARGSIRTLHESKIRTSTSMTEQLLAERIRFNARVLTRDGHDALRELCGFYFDVDQSFTVYEYRQLGKSAKALPVLSRQKYQCAWGPRKGDQYSVLDLFPGNTLFLDASKLKTLPRSLQSKKILKIRIADVDSKAKRAIIQAKFLGKRVHEHHWSEHMAQLHFSKLSEDDLQMQLSLLEMQEAVRAQLGRRGCPVLGGLFGFFRRRCREEGGEADSLARWTLEEGLRKFRVPLTEEDLDLVWEVADPDASGFADFGEYLRLALGEMNEARRDLVLKSYLKMDASKRGWITFSDVGKFHRSSQNASKVFKFLDAFDFIETKDVITFAEFEVYYEGLSVELVQDEDFFAEVLDNWNV